MSKSIICKGISKSNKPCKFKAKEGFEGYCKKCFKYKEIFENPDLKRCNECGNGFKGETKKCKICLDKRNAKQKLKESSVKKCEYKDCKYKSQKNENFCGKHLKISKKMANLELYCTKPNCPNLKKEGYRFSKENQLTIKTVYQKCEVCYNNQLKDNKRRKNNRSEIKTGFCTKCGVKIEKYKTDSGKEPKLCKKHYEMGKVAEAKRDERDRNWSEELSNYKEKYPDRYKEKLKKKRKFFKTLCGKIHDYNNKQKRNCKRKLLISEKWMKCLMNYKCFYCGYFPANGFNGIDRKNNDICYTYGNSVSCCQMCNMMKKKISSKDFIKICIHIADYDRTNGRVKKFNNIFKNHNNLHYSKYRWNCKQNGREFNLSRKQFKVITKQDCYLCGKENTNYHKNGIDRIDNLLCYINYNCIGCCGDCNMIKKDYIFKDLIKKCNEIKKLQISNNSFFRLIIKKQVNEIVI